MEPVTNGVDHSLKPKNAKNYLLAQKTYKNHEIAPMKFISAIYINFTNLKSVTIHLSCV
jgi:hypothetical protein